MLVLLAFVLVVFDCTALASVPVPARSDSARDSKCVAMYVRSAFALAQGITRLNHLPPVAGNFAKFMATSSSVDTINIVDRFSSDNFITSINPAQLRPTSEALFSDGGRPARVHFEGAITKIRCDEFMQEPEGLRRLEIAREQLRKLHVTQDPTTMALFLYARTQQFASDAYSPHLLDSCGVDGNIYSDYYAWNAQGYQTPLTTHDAAVAWLGNEFRAGRCGVSSHTQDISDQADASWRTKRCAGDQAPPRAEDVRRKLWPAIESLLSKTDLADLKPVQGSWRYQSAVQTNPASSNFCMTYDVLTFELRDHDGNLFSAKGLVPCWLRGDGSISSCEPMGMTIRNSSRVAIQDLFEDGYAGAR